MLPTPIPKKGKLTNISPMAQLVTCSTKSGRAELLRLSSRRRRRRSRDPACGVHTHTHTHTHTLSPSLFLCLSRSSSPPSPPFRASLSLPGPPRGLGSPSWDHTRAPGHP